MVSGADGEHILGHTPGNGQGIELLNILSTPDIRAVNSCQNWSLVIDDPRDEEVSSAADRDLFYVRYHHNIVQNSANQAANNLDSEGVSRRQMDVLSKLQISRKQLAHLQGIIREASKVQV